VSVPEEVRLIYTVLLL